MWSSLRPACVSMLLFTLLTGVIYPVATAGVAQLLFPRQAQGSLVEWKGRLVGSELIGQSFEDPRYFWPRPSATGPVSYNALGGSGSNLATTNPALIDAARTRIARLHEVDPGNSAPVPVDLITASASGLDPHISPAAARYQAGRVARLRGIDPAKLEALVQNETAPPTLGVLGQARVNVLRLNMALDTAFPVAAPDAPRR